MGKEKNVLQQKLEKSSQETTKIQTSLAQEEKNHKVTVAKQRKKIQELTKQITQMGLDHKHALEKKEEQYTVTETEMREQYEKEINDLSIMMNSKQFKNEGLSTSEQYAMYDKQFQARSEKQKQQNLYNNTVQDVEKLYQQKKDVFDELIVERDKKFESLVKEYDLYRIDMEKEIKMYDKEVALLYEYSAKLSHVLHQMEIGVYPVQMRFNTKQIRLTERDRPDPVRADLLPHLQKKMKFVNDFIRECESSPNKSFASLSLSRIGTASGPRSLQKPSLLQQIDLENKYNEELNNTAEEQVTTKPTSNNTTQRSRPSSTGSSRSLARPSTSKTEDHDIEFGFSGLSGLPSISEFQNDKRLKSLERENRELKVTVDVLKRQSESQQSIRSTSSTSKRPQSAVM
jgi:hypothetical protein